MFLRYTILGMPYNHEKRFDFHFQHSNLSIHQM